jgi:hypothetical protein
VVSAYATNLLRTGISPADLQASLYRALRLVPGLEVTDEAANLDGRVGTTMGVTDEHGRRVEAIIDPRTGEFIGERVIDADGVNETSTAVTTDGVDELGAVPPG